MLGWNGNPYTTYIAVGWGLLFMYITGPFKKWKWKSVIATSPVFIVPLLAIIWYCKETSTEVNGLPIFLVLIAAWWIANKIVKRRLA